MGFFDKIRKTFASAGPVHVEDGHGDPGFEVGPSASEDWGGSGVGGLAGGEGGETVKGDLSEFEPPSHP
jgi:hypothetical protein